MSNLIWKKVICITTKKEQEVKFNLYSDGLEIILPDGDKALIEGADLSCFIGLLTDDQ